MKKEKQLTKNTIGRIAIALLFAVSFILPSFFSLFTPSYISENNDVAQVNTADLQEINQGMGQFIDLTTATNVAAFEGKELKYTLLAGQVTTDLFRVRNYEYYWDPMPSQDVVAIMNTFNGTNESTGDLEGLYTDFKFYSRLNGVTTGVLHFYDFSQDKWIELSFTFLVKSNTYAHNALNSPTTKLGAQKYFECKERTIINASDVAEAKSINNGGLRILAASVSYPSAVDASAYTSMDIGIRYPLTFSPTTGNDGGYSSVTLIMRTAYFRPFSVEFLIRDSNNEFLGLVYCYITETTVSGSSMVMQGDATRVEDRTFYVPSSSGEFASNENSSYNDYMFSLAGGNISGISVHGKSGTSHSTNIHEITKPADPTGIPNDTVLAPAISTPTYKATGVQSQFDLVLQQNKQAEWAVRNRELWWCLAHGVSDPLGGTHFSAPVSCPAVLLSAPHEVAQEPMTAIYYCVEHNYVLSLWDSSVGGSGYNASTNTISHGWGPEQGTEENCTSLTAFRPKGSAINYYKCDHNFMSASPSGVRHKTPQLVSCSYSSQQSATFGYDYENRNTVPFYFRTQMADVASDFPQTANASVIFDSNVPQALSVSDLVIGARIQENDYTEIENVYAFDRGYVSVGLLNTGKYAKQASSIKIAPLRKTQESASKYIVLTVKNVTPLGTYRSLISVKLTINVDPDGYNSQFIKETNAAPVGSELDYSTNALYRGDRILLKAGPTVSPSVASDPDEDDFSFSFIHPGETVQAKNVLLRADQRTVVPESMISVYRGDYETQPNLESSNGYKLTDQPSEVHIITLVLEGVFPTETFYLKVQDANENASLIPIHIKSINRPPKMNEIYESITNKKFDIEGARVLEGSPIWREGMTYDKILLSTMDGVNGEKVLYNYGYDQDNTDRNYEAKEGFGEFVPRPNQADKRRDTLTIEAKVRDDTILRIDEKNFVTYASGVTLPQTIEIYALKQAPTTYVDIRIYDGYTYCSQYAITVSVKNTPPVRLSEFATDFIGASSATKTYLPTDFAFDLDNDTISIENVSVLDSYTIGGTTYNNLGIGGYINNYVKVDIDSQGLSFRLTALSKSFPNANFEALFGGFHFGLKVYFRDSGTHTTDSSQNFVIVKCRIENTAPVVVETSLDNIGTTDVPIRVKLVDASARSQDVFEIGLNSIINDPDTKSANFVRFDKDTGHTLAGSHLMDEVYITSVFNVNAKVFDYAELFFKSPQNGKVMYKYDVSFKRFLTDEYVLSLNELLVYNNTTGKYDIKEHYKNEYFPDDGTNNFNFNTSHNLLGKLYVRPLKSSVHVLGGLPQFSVGISDTEFIQQMNITHKASFPVQLNIGNLNPIYRKSDGDIGKTSSNPYIINMAKDSSLAPSSLSISPYMLITDTDLPDELISAVRYENREYFRFFEGTTGDGAAKANFISGEYIPAGGSTKAQGIYKITSSFLNSNTTQSVENTAYKKIGEEIYNPVTGGIVLNIGTQKDFAGNEVVTSNVNGINPLPYINSSVADVSPNIRNAEMDQLFITSADVKDNESSQYIDAKVRNATDFITNRLHISAINRHEFLPASQQMASCLIEVVVRDRTTGSLTVWIKVIVKNSTPVLNDAFKPSGLEGSQNLRRFVSDDILELTTVESLDDPNALPTSLSFAVRDVASDPDDSTVLEDIEFDTESARVYLDYHNAYIDNPSENGFDSTYVDVEFRQKYYSHDNRYLETQSNFYNTDDFVWHLVITANKNTTLLDAGHVYVGFRVFDRSSGAPSSYDSSQYLFLRIKVVNSIPAQTAESSKSYRLNNVIEPNTTDGAEAGSPNRSAANGNGYFAVMVRPEDSRVKALQAKLDKNVPVQDGEWPSVKLKDLEGTFNSTNKTWAYDPSENLIDTQTRFILNYDGYDTATVVDSEDAKGKYPGTAIDNYFARPLIVLNSDPDGDAIRLTGQTLRGGYGHKDFGAPGIDTADANLIGKLYEASASSIFDLSNTSIKFYDIHFKTEIYHPYADDPNTPAVNESTLYEVLWYAVIVFKTTGTGYVGFQVKDDGESQVGNGVTHNFRFSVSDTKIERNTTPTDKNGTALTGMKPDSNAVVGTYENPIRLQSSYKKRTQVDTNNGEYEYVQNSELILDLHKLFMLDREKEVINAGNNTTHDPHGNPYRPNMIMASSIANVGIDGDRVLTNGNTKPSYTYTVGSPSTYTRRNAGLTRTSEISSQYRRSSVASIEYLSSANQSIQVVSGYEIPGANNQGALSNSFNQNATTITAVEGRTGLNEYQADKNVGKIDGYNGTDGYSHYRGFVLRGKQRTAQPVELVIYVYVNGGAGYYEYEENYDDNGAFLSYSLLEIPLSIWVMVENSPIEYTASATDKDDGLNPNYSGNVGEDKTPPAGGYIVDEIKEVSGVDGSQDDANRNGMISSALGKRLVNDKTKTVYDNQNWYSIQGKGYLYDLNKSVSSARISTEAAVGNSSVKLPITDRDSDTLYINVKSIDGAFQGNLDGNAWNALKVNKGSTENSIIIQNRTNNEQKDLDDQYYYNNLNYSNKRDSNSKYAYTDFFDISTVEGKGTDGFYKDSQTLLIHPKRTTSILKYCSGEGPSGVGECNHSVDSPCTGTNVYNDGYFPLYFMVYDDTKNTARNNFTSDQLIKGFDATGSLDGVKIEDAVDRIIVCVRIYITNTDPTPLKTSFTHYLEYNTPSSGIYLSTLFKDADMQRYEGGQFFDANVPSSGSTQIDDLDTVGSIMYTSNLTDKVFYSESGVDGTSDGYIKLSKASYYNYDYSINNPEALQDPTAVGDARTLMTESDYKRKFYTQSSQLITVTPVRPVEDIEQERILATDSDEIALAKNERNRKARSFSFYVVITDWQNRYLYDSNHGGKPLTNEQVVAGYAICAVKITVYIKNSPPVQAETVDIQLTIREDGTKDSVTFQTYRTSTEHAFNSDAQGNKGVILAATDRELTYYNGKGTTVDNYITPTYKADSGFLNELKNGQEYKPAGTNPTTPEVLYTPGNKLHFTASSYTSVSDYLNTVYGTYLSFTASENTVNGTAGQGGVQLGPQTITVTAKTATPLPPNNVIDFVLYVSDNASEYDSVALNYRITVTKEVPLAKSDLKTFGLFATDNATYSDISVGEFLQRQGEQISIVSRPVHSDNNGRSKTVFRNSAIYQDTNFKAFMGDSDFVLLNDEGAMANTSSNSYISLTSYGNRIRITRLRSYDKKTAVAPTFTARFVVKDIADNGLVITFKIMLVNDTINLVSEPESVIELSPVSANSGRKSIDLKSFLKGGSNRPVDGEDVNSQYDVRVYETSKIGSSPSVDDIWKNNDFVASYDAFGAYSFKGFSTAISTVSMPSENGITFLAGGNGEDSTKSITFISNKRVSNAVNVTVVIRKQVWYITGTKPNNISGTSIIQGDPILETVGIKFNLTLNVPNSAPTVYSNRLPQINENGKSSLSLSVLLNASKTPQYSFENALCDPTTSASFIQDLDGDTVFIDKNYGFETASGNSGWEVLPYQDSFNMKQDERQDYENDYNWYRDDFERSLMLDVPDFIKQGNEEVANEGRIIQFGTKNKIVRDANNEPGVTDRNANTDKRSFVTLYIKVYIRDGSSLMQDFIFPVTITNNAPVYTAREFNYELKNNTKVSYRANPDSPSTEDIPITAWVADGDVGTSNEKFTVSYGDDEEFEQKALSDEGYEIKSEDGLHVLAILKAKSGWSSFTIEGKSNIRGAKATELVLTITDSSGVRASHVPSGNTIRINFNVINSAPKAIANPETFVLLASSVTQSTANTIVFLSEAEHIAYYSNPEINPAYDPDDSTTIPKFIKIFEDENLYQQSDTLLKDEERGYYSGLSDVVITGNEVQKITINATGAIASKGFIISTQLDTTGKVSKLRTGTEKVQITIYDGDPYVNADSLSCVVTITVRIVEDPTLMTTKEITMRNMKSQKIAMGDILDTQFTDGITISPKGFSILPYEGNAGTDNVENVLKLSEDGESIVATSVGRATVEATLLVSGYPTAFKVKFPVRVLANEQPLQLYPEWIVSSLDMEFENADKTGKGTYSLRMAQLFSDPEEDVLHFVSVNSTNKLIVEVSINPENDQILDFVCKAKGTVKIDVEVKDEYRTYSYSFNYVNEDMEDLSFFSSVYAAFLADPKTYIMWTAIVVVSILVLVIFSKIAKRRRMLKEEAEANMIKETALEDQYLQLQAANNNLQLGMGMDYNQMQIGQPQFNQMSLGQYNNQMQIGQAPTAPMFNQMQIGMSSDFMPGNDTLQLGEGMGSDFYDDQQNY